MSMGIGMNTAMYGAYGSYGNYGNYGTYGFDKTANGLKDNECSTCENRKYQDGSDDPGVSFKTAQGVSPERAASAVRSHEYEHVRRERAKAEREGAEVVNQNVRIKTSVCPECGKTYVSGGVTTTTIKKAVGEYKKVSFSKQDASGNIIDFAA